MPPLKSTNVTIGGKSFNPYTPLSNSSSYLIGGKPSKYTPFIGPRQDLSQPPKLNTTGAISSNALTKPVTPTDVMAKRGQMQYTADTTAKIQGMAMGTNPVITPSKTISNAESAALKFLNGERPPETAAQTQEKSILGGIRDKTKEFFGGREKQIEDAYKDSGVADARTSLAETQARKAERQVQLRNDLKALETTSAERGVAREFAVDRRNQINSDAYFDLANISIVESAQMGNLEQARTDAKELIDQQYNSYEAYIVQQQAELDYLKPTLTAEQKQQADIAQFNLDQYKQQLQDAKDEQSAKYDYLAEAAKNGAPNSVTEAIRKATTRDEAARLAAPYIGALDRANTYSLINERGKSSGGLSVAGQQLSALQVAGLHKTLSDTRGADGYANTQKYMDELNAFVSIGGDPKDFIKEFNPDIYINPQDPTRSFLSSQMKKAGGETDMLSSIIAQSLTQYQPQ